MQHITQELLQEVTRRLVAEFEPEQIYLFGSHAWGDPSEDSDLDLFVIVPLSNERPRQRAVRAHRCLSGLNVAKDILVRTREEVDLFRHVRASLDHEVLERGKVLYG